MNTLRKSFIIGMTVLALGAGTLSAQAHDTNTQGAHHGQMKAKWGERAAKRSAALHDTLKLSGEQEAAWAAYTAAIKRPERAPRNVADRAAWKAMPAPERMAKRLDMSRQRLAMMETRLAATTTFYAALNAEQKKVFDERSMARGGHHHRMKRGMAS